MDESKCRFNVRGLVSLITMQYGVRVDLVGYDYELFQSKNTVIPTSSQAYHNEPCMQGHSCFGPLQGPTIKNKFNDS